jgi:hypothetical protein
MSLWWLSNGSQQRSGGHRWIVLNFDAAYTIPGVDLLTVLFGQLQGVSIKLSLGLATYTSV